MPIHEGEPDESTPSDDLAPVQVDVNEPEAEELGDDAPTPPPEPQQSAPPPVQSGSRHPSPSHLRGKANRFADLSRKAEEAASRAQQLEQMLALERNSRQREIDILRSSQQQQRGPDPVEARLADIRELQSQLVAVAVDPNQTPEARKSAENRYHQLEDQRMHTIVQRSLAELEAQRPAADPQDAVIAHYEASLSDEFPEVMASGEFRGQAHAYYVHLVTNEGRRQGLEAQREAAAFVAAKRGLGGGRYVPTQRDRAASMGVPSRDNGNGRAGVYDFAQDDMRLLRGSGLSPTDFARFLHRSARE